MSMTVDDLIFALRTFPPGMPLERRLRLSTVQVGGRALVRVEFEDGPAGDEPASRGTDV